VAQTCEKSIKKVDKTISTLDKYLPSTWVGKPWQHKFPISITHLFSGSSALVCEPEQPNNCMATLWFIATMSVAIQIFKYCEMNNTYGDELEVTYLNKSV
jgi:hypothetical protein